MAQLEDNTYENARPPKAFHLFGRGVSFSISPTIHGTGFRHYGLPNTYDVRESESIDEVAGLIRETNFGGASVTMPHKLHVHKLCDEQTKNARDIGAINTLIVRDVDEKRKIIGDNTDWSGLLDIIRRYVKATNWQPHAGLVIGAGGASRAALFALHHAGLTTIYLVNRTLSVAHKVREDFKDIFEVTVVASLGGLVEKPEVIIGTVPAETTTEEQFHSLFGPRGLCVDMSYKPRQTPLLTVAQRHRGWTTVPGVDVLIAQGLEQFKLWTGLDPPRRQIEEAIAGREKEMETNTLDGKALTR